MSDRLTNLEIEDVLSSIRRLVSQEARPAGAEDAPVPRLVLTSELRVQPGRAPDLLTLADPIAPDTLPETARPNAPLHNRAAEIEQLLPEQDFESETGDSFPTSSVIDWPRQTVADDVLEAPFIDTDDDPDGDEALEDAAFEDEVFAQQTAATDVEDILDPVSDEDAFDEPAAQMLDEATLREIVREVLREELQGPMGNRVTRNLRRLIRSEIARAFAQDQDQ